MQEGVIIDMYVRKVRRKCGVRGCKNVNNVYIISKTREMSNSLILCTDCMKDGLMGAESYKEPEKVKSEPKPLFPHPELAVTISSVAVDEEEPKPQEVIEEVTEDSSVSVAEDTVTIEKNTGNPVVHDVAEAPKPTITSSKPKSNNKKKSTKKR